MRQIIFVLTFLTGVVAMAFPKVGDQAVYSRSDVIHGTKWSHQMKLTVTKLNDDEGYTFRWDYFSQSQNASGELTTPGWAAKISEKRMKDLLTNCQQNGGKSSVVVIKGQSIPSCIVKQNNNVEYEYADIPFYKVRQSEFRAADDYSEDVVIDFTASQILKD